jgi:hypothetical protein
MKDQDNNEIPKKGNGAFTYKPYDNSELNSFFRDLGKIGDALYKLGKINEETKKKRQKAYQDYIEDQEEKLRDNAKMLNFLFSERRRLISRITEAKINGETAEKKILDFMLRDIVDEKINEIKYCKANLKVPQILNVDIAQNFNADEDSDNEQNKFDDNAPEITTSFRQIDCNANKAATLDHFMRLCTKKNEINGKPYMEESDVIELLNNNFKVFKRPPKFQYFDINLTKRQKGKLRYFVYEFYNKYASNSRDKILYAWFIKNNFKQFKDDTVINIQRNMCSSKAPITANRI